MQRPDEPIDGIPSTDTRHQETRMTPLFSKKRALRLPDTPWQETFTLLFLLVGASHGELRRADRARIFPARPNFRLEALKYHHAFQEA